MVVGCLATVTGASFAITFATDTAICRQDSRSVAEICLLGLEKHIQRNGQLPPGLQKRVEPFPQDLVSQLPRIAERIRRVILGRRALMLDDHNTILDEFLLD